MKNSMELVPPSIEFRQLIKGQTTALLWPPVQPPFFSTGSIFGVFEGVVNYIMLYIQPTGNPIVASGTVTSWRRFYKSSLISKMLSVRMEAKKLTQALIALELPQQKEIHLMRYFIVCHLGGYEKLIAAKYLLDLSKPAPTQTGGSSVWFMWIRLLAPYAYLLFVYIFVLYVGSAMGAIAANRWLAAALLGLFIDVILQTCQLWTMFVFIPNLVRRRLIISLHLIRFRCKYIMSRTGKLLLICMCNFHCL